MKWYKDQYGRYWKQENSKLHFVGALTLPDSVVNYQIPIPSSGGGSGFFDKIFSGGGNLLNKVDNARGIFNNVRNQVQTFIPSGGGNNNPYPSDYSQQGQQPQYNYNPAQMQQQQQAGMSGSTEMVVKGLAVAAIAFFGLKAAGVI